MPRKKTEKTDEKKIDELKAAEAEALPVTGGNETAEDTVEVPPKKAGRVKGRAHKPHRMYKEDQQQKIVQDLLGERTVYNSPLPHKVRERTRKVGEDVWMALSPGILNPKGKEIVSSDPDLCFETMQKLLRVSPPKNECPFYFFDDDGSYGIGITTLSTCIDDNPDQTMAELIARYAEVRNVPFTDTALACLSLYRKLGGYFVNYYYHNGAYKIRPWHPTVANMAADAMPPKKRTEGLGDAV